MLGAKVVKKKGVIINSRVNNDVSKKKQSISEQKKIVSKFGILFAIVIILTICLYNIHSGLCKKIKSEISSKQRELQQVRLDMQNVKNIVNEWSRLTIETQKTSFEDKRAFVYDNINLEELAFEVDRKVNDIFDTSKIVREKDKEKRMVAGNFHIDIKQQTQYSNLAELESFINRLSVVNKNDIYVSSMTISVNFTTSYERVAYQIIEFLKKIFPGFLIVKRMSVKPTTSNIKTMYYDLKFKQKDISELVVNSVACEVEFDWIVLSKKNNDSAM